MARKSCKICEQLRLRVHNPRDTPVRFAAFVLKKVRNNLFLTVPLKKAVNQLRDRKEEDNTAKPRNFGGQASLRWLTKGFVYLQIRYRAFGSSEGAPLPTSPILYALC